MCKIFYITFFRLLQFWLWDLLIALLFWSDHACETEFYCMFTHISKALYNFLWILWVQESQIQDSGMFLLYQSILLPCYHELVCICIRWFCFGSILLCGHVCRLASFSNYLVHCNLKFFSGLWKSSTPGWRCHCLHGLFIELKTTLENCWWSGSLFSYYMIKNYVVIKSRRVSVEGTSSSCGGKETLVLCRVSRYIA